MKLNHLSLYVLALLPMAAAAQTATPSMVQTETATVHHSEEAAIEHVMKQFP
jgi:hypothetical protein